MTKKVKKIIFRNLNVLDYRNLDDFIGDKGSILINVKDIFPDDMSINLFDCIRFLSERFDYLVNTEDFFVKSNIDFTKNIYDKDADLYKKSIYTETCTNSVINRAFDIHGNNSKDEDYMRHGKNILAFLISYGRMIMKSYSRHNIDEVVIYMKDSIMDIHKYIEIVLGRNDGTAIPNVKIIFGALKGENAIPEQKEIKTDKELPKLDKMDLFDYVSGKEKITVPSIYEIEKFLKNIGDGSVHFQEELVFNIPDMWLIFLRSSILTNNMGITEWQLAKNHFNINDEQLLYFVIKGLIYGATTLNFSNILDISVNINDNSKGIFFNKNLIKYLDLVFKNKYVKDFINNNISEISDGIINEAISINIINEVILFLRIMFKYIDEFTKTMNSLKSKYNIAEHVDLVIGSVICINEHNLFVITNTNNTTYMCIYNGSDNPENNDEELVANIDKDDHEGDIDIEQKEDTDNNDADNSNHYPVQNISMSGVDYRLITNMCFDITGDLSDYLIEALDIDTKSLPNKNVTGLIDMYLRLLFGIKNVDESYKISFDYKYGETDFSNIIFDINSITLYGEVENLRDNKSSTLLPNNLSTYTRKAIIYVLNHIVTFANMSWYTNDSLLESVSYRFRRRIDSKDVFGDYSIQDTVFTYNKISSTIEIKSDIVYYTKITITEKDK